METLKQALAFPMYATAAYLVWVIAQQAGPSALAATLIAAVLLGFAAWSYGRTQGPVGVAARWASRGAAVLALGTVLGAAWSVSGERAADSSQSAASRDGWEAYSPQRLEALRAAGQPVFVNLTAAWCITCLANERVALSTDQVEAAFIGAGIVRLKGDWTRRDERITELLTAHGRSGVPLYLFYPAGRGSQAVVLPQLLTPQTVLAAIDSAAQPSSNQPRQE
jgi:thiol:disulfide interchange protein DsbD